MPNKKNLTEILRQRLKSFLTEDQPVIAAVSGGSDSICLLDNLRFVHKNIIAAHVNYQTRPDSHDEEKFVRDFCSKHGIGCEVLQAKELMLDSPNFEARARDIRYQFFADTAKKYHASLIMTAHHQDDLLENIFIRLFRGSGKLFLSLERRMGAAKIIRPLLDFTKAEILAVNRENGVSWCEDLSNKNTDFLRNYIRLDLLPALEKRIPNLTPSLLHLSAVRAEEESFLEDCTVDAQNSIVQDHSFSIDAFFSLAAPIQKRFLHKQLRIWFEREFSAAHISEIIRMSASEKHFFTLHTEKNRILYKNGKKIIFIPQNDNKNLEKIAVIFHNNKIRDNSLFWQASWAEEGIKLDALDILSLRVPEKNEKILLNQGFRQVSSLLKDAKIPAPIRHLSRIIDKNGTAIGIIAPDFIKIHQEHCSKTKGLKITRKFKDFL